MFKVSHHPLTLCVAPQVKNAMLAGAKGIIMFSDPADYWAAGVQVLLVVFYKYQKVFLCSLVSSL